MNSRVRAIGGTALFLGLVAGYVPHHLLRFESQIESGLIFLLPYGGAVLFVLGIVLSFSAVYYLGKRSEGRSRQRTQPHRLVVAGPYTYLQHPALLGMLVMLCGEALWLRSPTLGLYAAVVALSSHTYVVYVEEPQLARRFGRDYCAYQRAIPRWIPQLMPAREDDKT